MVTNYHIRQRLDRALANSNWITSFPKASFAHLVATSSNHNPMFLKLWHTHEQKSTPFRFEQAWTKHPTCKITI